MVNYFLVKRKTHDERPIAKLMNRERSKNKLHRKLD